MTSLHIETKDGITTIELDRPPVNALDITTCHELATTFDAFADETGTRCVILAAAGSRAFCAGLDFRAFLDATDDQSSRNALLRHLYGAIYRCALPVIAAIDRPAIGAGSVIASVCDIRIAAEAATFTLPEIDVGRIGGAAHHGRLLPQGTLRRMVFTGAVMTAREAYRVGFVDQVVEADARSAAREVAHVIASKSPTGIRHAKASLNEIESLDAETGYAREQERSAVLRQTTDAQEAARAVLERRQP
jgi:enoyl-CoA hydratase